MSDDKSKKVGAGFNLWARTARRRSVVFDVPGAPKSQFSEQMRAEFKRAQAGESREDELKREIAESEAEIRRLRDETG